MAEYGVEPAEPRVAIVDIGSNSIRLVVYQGPPRLPAILFNEKVLAGLGRSLAETGTIDAAAMDLAKRALARFATIARAMAANSVMVVATAAVRDASNGHELIEIAHDLGFEVEVLSGEEEALAAGNGVLAGIPDANGIVGDLGGGSLELVRVKNGSLGERASFPLGVLRIEPMRAAGRLDRQVKKHLTTAGWIGRGKALPLYLVGGSWRGLARLDMHVSAYPLPIIHQYPMSSARITRLGRTISHVGKGRLKAVPGLSSGRIPTLGAATALLGSLLKHLKASGTVVSAYGLREGLLFGRLDAATRAQDPLLIAARDEGRRSGRFPEHGDLLHRWTSPVFAGENTEDERLRHAACLLADVGWRANPEFRAERGLEIAIHGNWVGIDARGRAMLGQALWTSLGGTTTNPAPLAALADAASLRRATAWGLAIRLGQRLSAGLSEPLEQSSLSADPTDIILRIHRRHEGLYGETVEKRHAALATFLGKTGRLES